MAYNKRQPVSPKPPVKPVASAKPVTPAKPAKPVKSVVKNLPKASTKMPPSLVRNPIQRQPARPPMTSSMAARGNLGMQNPVPFNHPQLGPGLFVPMPGMKQGSPGQPQMPQSGMPMAGPSGMPMGAAKPSRPILRPNPIPAGTSRPLNGVQPSAMSNPKAGLPGGQPPQI